MGIPLNRYIPYLIEEKILPPDLANEVSHYCLFYADQTPMKAPPTVRFIYTNIRV